MKENLVKYIILDFGKVLAGPTTGNWFITPIFLKLVDMEQVDVEKINQVISKYHNILNRKIITLEEEYQMFYEFYDSILKEIRYPKYSSELVSRIAFNMTYEEDKYTFYDGVKEELNALAKRYQLLMLTDNWPCVIPILKNHGLYDYFEKVYVSSVYGTLKEEGIFFDYPIHDFEIGLGEAIFIDDNETLLDIAVKKGLQVSIMDREHKLTRSKYPILHNLDITDF